MIADLEVKQILIESLTFENANSQYKKVIGPLKVRSTPIEEWI